MPNLTADIDSFAFFAVPRDTRKTRRINGEVYDFELIRNDLIFSDRGVLEISSGLPFNMQMRVIFILLSTIAGLLTILIIGLTVLSIISGGGSIALPGLGLIISLPFAILFLIAVDAAIIACALLCRRLSRKHLP